MDTDNQEYAASAQFLATSMVAMMRPDIMVMDTVPQGSFGEFLQLRNFCRKAAFINRHKSEARAGDPVHLSHLPLYDLILTPDSASQGERYVLPDEMKKRNVFTGVIHGVRREEMMPRDEVRGCFGARPAQTLFYVSAGGGGDRHAVRELAALVDELAADPDHLVLVGYGPLFRGTKRYGANIIPLSDPDVRRYFGGVDCAVCAAGYNTYEELLAAGVPAAFYAQVKGMDAQDERVALGAARGWNLHLQDFDPLSIREMAARLKSPTVRSAITRALAGREESRGSLRAAVELLRLHATLPSSAIEADALFAAAAMRAAWSGVAVARGIAPDESRGRFTESARAALGLLARKPAGERAAFFDGARLAILGDGPLHAAREAVTIGAELSETRAELGCSARVIEGLIREFARSVAPVDTLADPAGAVAFRDFSRNRYLSRNVSA